jgi:Ca-activated chloride channel homolog
LDRVSFQNPGALVWFLPLAAIVIALYLLKLRRRDLRVPATFLWPAQVEEIRANALIQKLRPSWLLFLQLLALALAVSALARPQTRQSGLAGSTTVLVIDATASMAATDVRPNRLEEAKRLAREAILEAKRGDRIALIEAGASAKVVFPLGNDPARQLHALETVQSTDAEGDMGDALRLAGALVGGIDGSHIVLFSDGDFEPVANFARGKSALTYHRIGAYDDNLGITALGTGETNSGRQVYVAVKNFSTKPMEGILTVYGDGHPVDSLKTGLIAPASVFGKSIPVASSIKVLEAKLGANDALKSDNYAVCVVNPGASLKVLLVGHGDPFLERALALDPRVTLDKATIVPNDQKGSVGQSIPTEGGKYDLVVFDGVPEEPVKARGVLTFGLVGPASPVQDLGLTKAGAFISATNNPLLRGVDLRGVYMEGQHKVAPKAIGSVIADSTVGPLVVEARTEGRRQVYVAFDPMQSDFPLQVGFPIFIGNVLDYVSGGHSAEDLTIKAGTPFTVPTTDKATLTKPDGTTEEINPTGSVLVVRQTNRIGTYLLQVGKKKRRVFAYMRNDRASSISPAKDIAIGGGQVKESPANVRFGDFWRPLGLACLLVLAGEWWLFVRRS